MRVATGSRPAGRASSPTSDSPSAVCRVTGSRRAGRTVLARISLIPWSPSSPAARVPLQPPLPAGIVPVTAVLQAAGVGRPGDQVGGARRDLLVAARAAVGLRAGGPGHRPDHPVPVGRRFGPLGAEPQRGAVRLLIPARA